MKTYVLDASVALKWPIPASAEPLFSEARALLGRHSKGEIEFVVPDLFWAEVANVLARGARRGRWSWPDAEEGLEQMLSRDFATVPSQHLLREAFDIAFAYDRSIYDCFYVALAVESKTDLITADERLANALAARFPVKWLGAFQV